MIIRNPHLTLRHLMLANIKAEQAHIHSMNPSYLAKRGDDCEYFICNQLQESAFGMVHLFDKIPYNKVAQIRTILIRHFGRNGFYRRKIREKCISPNDQEYIKRVFKECGVEQEVVFDEYIRHYDWWH
ncbi:MAG: DUF6078 family protein [Bacteroidales bacterium]